MALLALRQLPQNLSLMLPNLIFIHLNFSPATAELQRELNLGTSGLENNFQIEGPISALFSIFLGLMLWNN